jgi:hypothetical protein
MIMATNNDVFIVDTRNKSDDWKRGFKDGSNSTLSILEESSDYEEGHRMGLKVRGEV